ncbi:MAG: hypothetical protein MZV70_02875 [Desulfobacterales bacterium]|nr:hypothetical protein [Desulfobacterales bacterium]
MNASEPLYNSRLTKTYVLYLHHRYPGVEVEPLLEKAGIYRYQIEDSAHWLTQDQVDRFHAAAGRGDRGGRHLAERRPLRRVLRGHGGGQAVHPRADDARPPSTSSWRRTTPC